MNYNKILADFNEMFLTDNQEEVLLQFLKSYELQRKMNLDMKSAFVNSIHTPTKNLSWKKIQEISKKEKQLTIELKKKRSKKYMTLFRYQADIFRMKKENISLENIAKYLIIKYSLPKNLQPSRQNIFNFLKDYK